jgi:2-oxoisovalerate dehydrogenase E1 component alpha subunit
LGFYLTSTGEEATHIGSAYAMGKKDWIFPCYREPGAALIRGFPLQDYINQCYGNSEDLEKGRQMPCHYGHRETNLVTISSPVGTQIPQAAGAAWGAKINGDNVAVLVYFGDGATSQGDFHVGLNFAGVSKAPVLFFCRNNGYAISTPFEKQTASENICVKAKAYGVEGIQVDGNDILAIISVTKTAREAALKGKGPTLIEALTYRVGAHSTSDDPSAYRGEGELETWKIKDPLERFKNYLAQKGIWNEDMEHKYQEETKQEIQDAVEHAEKIGPPAIESLFEDVYAEMPPSLQEQRDELLRFVKN